MSESTQASAPPGGKGKKILGMSQGQLLIVLAVALGGGAFLLWRSRKNKAAQQQQTATSACPDGSQPDANGNCVQGGQDWSGAIATLQTEIADLQGAGSGGAGGGAGTVGGSAGAGTGGVNPGGTFTGGAGAGTTTTAPPAQAAAGAISNLQASSTSRTGFTVRWNPANGAKGGYRYVVTQLNGVQVKSGNTSGTSVSVSGLHPGWTYNFGVQALPGGAGNNIHVRLPS